MHRSRIALVFASLLFLPAAHCRQATPEPTPAAPTPRPAPKGVAGALPCTADVVDVWELALPADPGPIRVWVDTTGSDSAFDPLLRAFDGIQQPYDEYVADGYAEDGADCSFPPPGGAACPVLEDLEIDGARPAGRSLALMVEHDSISCAGDDASYRVFATVGEDELLPTLLHDDLGRDEQGVVGDLPCDTDHVDIWRVTVPADTQAAVTVDMVSAETAFDAKLLLWSAVADAYDFWVFDDVAEEGARCAVAQPGGGECPRLEPKNKDGTPLTGSFAVGVGASEATCTEGRMQYRIEVRAGSEYLAPTLQLDDASDLAGRE